VPPQSLPDLPDNYIVLHGVPAHPLWPAAHWQALADAIRGAAVGGVVLRAGEDAPLREIDPPARCTHGRLSQPVAVAPIALFAQLDTGVAHLAKVAGTPLLMLFGPGSEVLFGASRFFAHYHRPGGVPPFSRRNQRSVHHRDVDWALRCFRRFWQWLMNVAVPRHGSHQ
jgi:ADP-heptose:LPS heptosyltransferase